MGLERGVARPGRRECEVKRPGNPRPPTGFGAPHLSNSEMVDQAVAPRPERTLEGGSRENGGPQPPGRRFLKITNLSQMLVNGRTTTQQRWGQGFPGVCTVVMCEVMCQK